MNKNDSFVLYTDYAEKLKKLPLEQIGAVFLAIFDYVTDGKEPNLEPAADMCFSFIKSQIDRDKEKYETIKKQRAESGSKGGKRRAENIMANQANANFGITNEANQADNVYVSGNVNENGNVSDNEDVIDTHINTSKHPECNSQNKKKNEALKVQYAEYVTMTESERQKLVEEYGEKMTERMITMLDNYKGSTGKKYKSDYRAILSWVVDKIKKEQVREASPQISGGTITREFKPSTGFRNA